MFVSANVENEESKGNPLLLLKRGEDKWGEGVHWVAVAGNFHDSEKNLVKSTSEERRLERWGARGETCRM